MSQQNVFYLINTDAMRLIACTETADEAEYLSKAICNGDNTYLSCTDNGRDVMAAFSLSSLNKLIKPFRKVAEIEFADRDRALSRFLSVVNDLGLTVPDAKKVSQHSKKLADSKPQTHDNTEDSIMSTKPSSKSKAAGKKAPVKPKAVKAVKAVKAKVEKAPKIAKVGARPLRGKTLELWEMFDKASKSATATRSGMIGDAVAAGYNVATATTQYGRWLNEHVANGGAAPVRAARTVPEKPAKVTSAKAKAVKKAA